MRLSAFTAALIWWAWTGVAWATTCETRTFENVPFSFCRVDAQTDAVRLFLYDSEGAVLGQFSAIDEALAAEGLRLSFAMNAGMYHPDRRPVGYYVEDGREAQQLMTRAGPGNFGLLPNGVFCARSGRLDVIETLTFQKVAPVCDFASQSGPMLVIDGALHPRFLESGTSKFIRNGVGTTSDGQTAIFVMSDAPVNFHTFARFFKDVLKLPQALYFDGNISRLYAPELDRKDFGFSLGPIVGTVVPLP